MLGTAHQIRDQAAIDPHLNQDQTLIAPRSDFKVIACIDMDAFYAQAEARRFGFDDSVPVVVIQWSGCIAISYAARKNGVTRMMRVDEIRRRCPEVICIHVDTLKVGQPYIGPYERDLKEKYNLVRNRDLEKANLDYYRSESEKVLTIFRKNCEIVEKASIDESFMDLTEEVMAIYNKGEYEKEWKGKINGGPVIQPETQEEIMLMIGSHLVNNIRRAVHSALKYTCSAGISYNKMLAKVASGMNKPDDQTVILNRYVEDALKPVSIGKLRNFGGKVAEAFEGAGFKTLADIQKMNLEEVEKIVKDDHCAKWVYFRCRGYDDEVVEEKDYTNKSYLSHKNFDTKVTNMLDLENIEDLVLSDLCSRIIGFYNQSGMVPSTLNLHFYDNTAYCRKTKSGPINLKLKPEKFFDALKAKTQDLIKTVANVIFPCKFMAVSAKNFQKNDAKTYGFDLLTYAREKQKQKELEMEKQAERQKQLEKAKEEKEKEFHEFDDKELLFLNEKLDRSLDMGEEGYNGIMGGDFENLNDYSRSKANTIVLDEEDNEDLEEKKNTIENAIVEKKEVEMVICEKCNELIEKEKLIDHLDFHVAQDLDKELNPNKRKYKKMDSGSVSMSFTEKESSNSMQSKPVKSKIIEVKSQGAQSSKNSKKNNEKNNNGGKKAASQMMSLDNFFTKK